MTDWPAYLAQFHGARPGVTETLLGACRGPDGVMPYRWLTRALDADRDTGLTVDLGCGSGPVAGSFDPWVGADVSPEELAAARNQGRGPLVAGAAEAVPLADDSATTVLFVMSLMVVDQPGVALREAARLLRPGGRLGILLPAQSPLSVGDVARYGALLAALGQRATPFPHRELSTDLLDLLEETGFELTGDDRVRFGFPMEDATNADLLVDALYLPGVSDRRLRWAKTVARRWGHADMGLALRRVTATRRVDAMPTGPAPASTGSAADAHGPIGSAAKAQGRAGDVTTQPGGGR